MDFASRIASAESNESSAIKLVGSVAAGEMWKIRENMESERLYFGEINQAYSDFDRGWSEGSGKGRKIGFLTRGIQVQQLFQGGKYM